MNLGWDARLRRRYAALVVAAALIWVPEWFYRHYRDRDELDFADTAEGHRRRLAA